MRRPPRPRAVVLVVAAVALVGAALLVLAPLGADDPEVAGPDGAGRSSPSDRSPASPSARPSTAAAACGGVAEEQLAWAPPDGWPQFERVAVPRDGGRLRLDDDTDYVLESDGVVTGGVEIVGGGDVVWVGGHVRIEDAGGVVGHGERRGLLVRDDGGEQPGRVVHLEGLLFDGGDLAEGVDLDAPSAVVQVQNVHVGTVRFRSADDRDGTGAYEEVGRNHPDVLQTYGGQRELRVDGLTGSTSYQGLFFKEDHDDAPGGRVTLRRVDIEGVAVVGEDGVEYAANRLYFVDVRRSGDHRLEDGTVWLDVHPDAGKVAGASNPRDDSGSWWHGAFRDDRGDLVLEQPPGTAEFTDGVEYKDPEQGGVAPSSGVDATGRYLHWPHVERAGAARILATDGSPGRVHAGPAPTPCGDYVPAASVGTAYTTPGYQPTS